MRATIARSLYVALLRLHPEEFQRRYASEMLATFDEAVQSFSPAWLLREAVASVLRQHLLRRPADPVAAADGPVGLISGVYPLMEPFELRAERLLLAVVLSVTMLRTVFPIIR
jgi:hypothetical protein